MIASCSARSGSTSSLPLRATGDDPECECLVEDNVSPQAEFAYPRRIETPARNRDSEHERLCDLDAGRKEHCRRQANILAAMRIVGTTTIIITATGTAYRRDPA
jgi:hypothetical protein